jgi:tellurite methyltransferase
MDQSYWNDYYSKDLVPQQPSNFALFCFDEFRDHLLNIFDLGCGNGRDSFFFSKNSLNAIGIDQSEKAIKENIIKSQQSSLPCKFINDDFSVFDYDAFCTSSLYSLYSRFTLHSINYKDEEILFNKIYNLRNLDVVFIEARTINDNLYGQGSKLGLHEFFTDHYRRFIDPEILRSKLEKKFDILYFEERTGFSKNDYEDPCLVRVVAKLKR